MLSEVSRGRIERILDNEQEEDRRGARILIEVVSPIAQNGPQCGLVALAMAFRLLHLDEEKSRVENILSLAKEKLFTRNGEMFSVDWLVHLAQTIWPDEIVVKACPFPSSNREMVSMLQSRNALIIPYDCDKNHEPALFNGHKAHWCLVVGFVLCSSTLNDTRWLTSDDKDEMSFEMQDGDSLHLICLHGKSRHAGVWHIDKLRTSNNGLNSTLRQPELYVLPSEGVAALRGRIAVLQRLR